MKKKILSFLMIMTIAAGVTAVDIFALEDGVYIVSNTTSYVNPDTGKTDDGGSDTSLGDGMARGMTHETSFYEVIEGKHYITVRIGMVSYIDNMRFKVQSEKGKGDYKSISYKVVGENKEEDTRDYRIEIPSIDFRISPTFFVGPMNRDVVFFISFNSASIKEDDGSLGGYTREAEKSNSVSTNEETPSTVQESTGISGVHSISEENKQKSTTEVEKKNLENPSLLEEVEEAEKSLQDSKLAAEFDIEKDSLKTNELTKEDVVKNSIHLNEVQESNAIKSQEENASEIQGLAEFDSQGVVIKSQDEEKDRDINFALFVIPIFFLCLGGYFIYIKKLKK